MLKSATEIAAAARVARASALEDRRAKDEKNAMVAQQQAWLDKLHMEFESHALAAARVGDLAVAFPGHELSLNKLRTQGFIAAQLSRRTSFEEHLAEIVRQKNDEMAQLAERVVALCPGFELIAGDALLHRNPLVSLIQTLWSRAQIREPYDVELLLAFARTQSAAKHSDLEAQKIQISTVLDRFAEVKTTEQKYYTVRWENSIIPKGTDKATYASWESADNGQGMVVKFSAQRVSWLAKTWPLIVAFLNESIEESASKGSDHMELFVWRSSEGWDLSLTWPPEGDMYGKESEDLENQNVGHWKGETFCAPSLAAEELTFSGYTVDIQSLEINSMAATDTTHKDIDKFVAAGARESYRMKILWE